MGQYGNVEKKRVTIYSVAKEAGVSLATVSRVINEFAATTMSSAIDTPFKIVLRQPIQT